VVEPPKKRGRPKGSKNKQKNEPIQPDSAGVPKGSQRKKWVFTMNNYDQQDVEKLDLFFDGIVKSGAYQSEIGPRTGTKHIQGFFILHRRMRFQQFGLKPGTHFEPMRGTIEENLGYTQKTDSFDEEANLRRTKGINIPEPVSTIERANFFQ
jgi:hypothetical protein